MYLDNYKHLLQKSEEKKIQKIICMKKLFLGKNTCNI
jgi:hypothetical protein